ncbi:MAG: DUF6078 family protein [Mediterranea sp.]|nr:DUF6078 family protein [Mediterranea sp.]
MKKEDFDYSLIPGNFLYCLNRQCPRSGECLRYLLSEYGASKDDAITVVSPTFVTRDCRFYAPNRKVRFALGITTLYDDLPHKVMRTLKQMLIAYFSQATYYRWKRQERLISPEEQGIILCIFRSVGIQSAPRYDQYVEQYEWQTSVLVDSHPDI